MKTHAAKQYISCPYRNKYTLKISLYIDQFSTFSCQFSLAHKIYIVRFRAISSSDRFFCQLAEFSLHKICRGSDRFSCQFKLAEFPLAVGKLIFHKIFRYRAVSSSDRFSCQFKLSEFPLAVGNLIFHKIFRYRAVSSSDRFSCQFKLAEFPLAVGNLIFHKIFRYRALSSSDRFSCQFKLAEFSLHKICRASDRFSCQFKLAKAEFPLAVAVGK